MEGLNSSEIQKPTKKFDHATYAKYLKINKPKAKEYIDWFQKEYEEIKNGKQAEVTITKPVEQVPEPSGVKSELPSDDKKDDSSEVIANTIVFTDWDIDELKRVYKEKSGKKAYHGWNGEQLVWKINNIK